jgi:thioredoxin reductase (NADPH)
VGDEQVLLVLKALNKTIAEVFDIPATGFFVAIGPRKPNTDIFKDFITLDETGYIINTQELQNVEDVFCIR